MPLSVRLSTLRSVAAAAIAVLAALTSVTPAQAVPATHADIYFRRTIDNPFADPGFFAQQDGTSHASLNATRPEGSSARFDADATAGSLKAYANALPAFSSGQEAWARGSINDRFRVYGPTDGNAVHITATYTIDGLLSGPGSNPESLLAFANAAVLTRFVGATSNLAHERWARTESEMSNCWQAGCSGFSVPIHWVDQIELDVLAGSPFDLYYSLAALGGWAYGGSVGTADFGSTGKLSFALPLGVRIESEGGFSQSNIPVENPEPSAGVPEPSVATLMVCGLIGLARRSGRRHLARNTGPS